MVDPKRDMDRRLMLDERRMTPLKDTEEPKRR